MLFIQINEIFHQSIEISLNADHKDHVINDHSCVVLESNFPSYKESGINYPS